MCFFVLLLLEIRIDDGSCDDADGDINGEWSTPAVFRMLAFVKILELNASVVHDTMDTATIKYWRAATITTKHFMLLEW